MGLQPADRGWQERPVSGKMRYAYTRGLQREDKPEEYLEKVERLVQESRAEAL